MSAILYLFFKFYKRLLLTAFLLCCLTRDGEGRLHLSIVNLDPARAAEISTTLTGTTFKNITGEVRQTGAL